MAGEESPSQHQKSRWRYTKLATSILRILNRSPIPSGTDWLRFLLHVSELNSLIYLSTGFALIRRGGRGQEAKPWAKCQRV